MPKKSLFKKEEIFNTAYELFESKGLEAITARNLAKALDSSPAPIYNYYNSMEDLKTELINKAKQKFLDYIKRKLTDLTFLNVGIGICIFAREERQLFCSIFLKEKPYGNLIKEFRDMVRTEMDMDNRFKDLLLEFKYELFQDCWFYAHGLATLIATGYFITPSDEFITKKLLNGPAIMLYEKMKQNSK